MDRRTRFAARAGHARFVVRPLFAALVASGIVAPAQGATINVTTPGDTSSATSCTLRDAIASLNGGAVVNGCSVASGVFGASDTVNLASQSGTIGLTGGALVPMAPMLLQGPGASALTVSGLGASRVINWEFSLLAIDGLTIANGLSQGPGGCIFAGQLVLSNSVVSGCTATDDPNTTQLDGLGGGIAVKYLNSYRSTIVGNTAANAGGGAFAYGGVFTESRVSGNTVTGAACSNPQASPDCMAAFLGGGGILGYTVITLGSTISGNTVNASAVTKYDAQNQPYTVNVGLGGGIAQWPIDYYTNERFALKSKARAAGALAGMFGPDARSRPGPAKAAVHAAKLAAARAGRPANKADGQVEEGLGIAFSTISGNRVTGNRANPSKYGGGGVFSFAFNYNAEVANSTISGNRLDAPFGDYTPGSAMLTFTADFSNNTITGNVGSIGVAMVTLAPTGLAPASSVKRAGPFAKAWTTWQRKLGAPQGKAGLPRNKAITPPVFDSTIIANAGAQYDLDCLGPSCTIGGSNNLILSWSDNTTVPPDTLTSNPLLAPLGNNGGVAAGAPGHPLTAPMPTHLLFVGSPAIDAGSNPESFTFDQRGPGFPRVAGSGPDIGAIEGIAALPVELPVPGLAPWLVAVLSALLGALGLRSRRRSP